MSKRKQYTKDFKMNVISMVKEQGLKQAEVARTMGLHVNTINNWIKEYELSSSPNPSNSNVIEKENKELKRKLAELEEENEILKKAAAFFAKNQK